MGPLPAAFAAVSTPAVLLLALLPQGLAIAGWFRGGQESARSFEYAAIGGTIGLLIGGKVLSPQFIIWIAPLVAIAADGAEDVCAIVAIGVLTTLVYPYLAPALEQRETGHGWALTVLALRNALLVGWYGVAIRRASPVPAHAD